MSARAKFITKTGEQLRISRGDLTIFTPTSGITTRHSLAGPINFDRKLSKLHVSILNVLVNKDTKDRTLESLPAVYDIVVAPEILRAQTRLAYATAEARRLVESASREAAVAHAKKYKLSAQQLVAAGFPPEWIPEEPKPKAAPAPTPVHTISAEPSKKKAKDRRQEAQDAAVADKKRGR